MSRWDEIDYPVLKAIHDHEITAISEGRSPDISGPMITEASGIEGGQLANSLLKLWDDSLIQAWGQRGIEVNVIKGVTPSGLRELKEWPGDETVAAILPALLEELAARSNDEADKTLLSRAGTVLESVAAATISAAVGQVTGLS